MTAQLSNSPEFLESANVVLGQSRLPAETYVRTFGGIVVRAIGSMHEMASQIALSDVDETGLVTTLCHVDIAAQANAASNYFYTSASAGVAKRYNSGLHVRFADFQGNDAPTYVYEASIDSGNDSGMRLWCEEIMYENSTQTGTKNKEEVDNPKVLLETLLYELAKYHKHIATMEQLKTLQQGQIARAAELQTQPGAKHYTDKRGWLRSFVGKQP